jgi:hypothetical protein
MSMSQYKPPSIKRTFNPNLLSVPTFGFSSKRLKMIFDYVDNRINKRDLNKFPNTISKLKILCEQFVELYEKAKEKEEDTEAKTPRQTEMLGYRPRLSNKNDQRVFEGLRARVRSSY